jgi:tRNA 2-thiouridine synthesizing protein E
LLVSVPLNKGADVVATSGLGNELNYVPVNKYTQTISGKTVQVNDEGFMTNPAEWTKEIAVEIAKEEGIAELTATHWTIIEFCRKTAGSSGGAPTLRTITAGAGFSTKDLFALFPKGPAKKVAKISGLGKPEGCV